MYLNLPHYLFRKGRFFSAAAGSVVMTTGLVLLMAQLIAVDDSDFVEGFPPIAIDYYEVRPELEPIVKPPKVEKPPEVEKEPTPPPALTIEAGNGGMEFVIAPPVPTDSINISRTALTDGEHIPIVKVQPNYPNTAAKRGIEGYVILSFTILPSGATANAEVIESQPNSVFDKSALKAVERFKYKPKVVDGVAQPVHNVHHRLTYELANG
jgi:protein TonB